MVGWLILHETSIKNRPTNFSFSWQSQCIHFSPRWKCSGYRSGQSNTYLIYHFLSRSGVSFIFHQEALAHAGKSCLGTNLSSLWCRGWAGLLLTPEAAPQLRLTPAAHNQSKFSKLHIDFPLMTVGWLSAAKGRTMLCSTQSDNDQPGVKTYCRHSFIRPGSQNSFNERNNKTNNTNEGPLIVLL